MTIRRAVRCLALVAGLAALGEAAAQAPFADRQAALDTNTLQGGISTPDPGPAVTPGAVDPGRDLARPAPRPQGAGEPHGNPLWAIPLKSLSVTRERPIFLPSRRPPAPAVAGPPPAAPARPPPPPEPERPRLALVGAVVGETEGIAIFLDQATRGIIRLRTGENHSGWVLRSVKSREATLEKNRESILLALPAPSDPAAAVAGIPGLPGPAGVPGMPAAMPGVPGPGATPGVPGLVPPPPGAVMPRPPGGKEPEL
jgi:hypothetical protein